MRASLLLFATLLGCGSGGVWTGDDDGAPSTKAAQDASSTSTQDADVASDAAVIDDTNFSTQTVCTSGTMWTLGDTKSDLMHPGVACRKCHYTLGPGSKDFDIAGTVYPTAH